MGRMPHRSTTVRRPRGTTLALLCVLGGMIVPATAPAQATTAAKPPATTTAPPATTAPDAPDATDAATPAPPAAGDGAAAPDAAATPPAGGAGATPDAGAADPAAPVADPTAPTTTAPAGAEDAPATGVVVQEPDDSLPGWVWGAVAVGIVVAALVAWMLVLASGRFERLAPVGHALGEAGWRLSNRWAEFVDWLRFGSGR